MVANRYQPRDATQIPGLIRHFPSGCRTASRVTAKPGVAVPDPTERFELTLISGGPQEEVGVCRCLANQRRMTSGRYPHPPRRDLGKYDNTGY